MASMIWGLEKSMLGLTYHRLNISPVYEKGVQIVADTYSMVKYIQGYVH